MIRIIVKFNSQDYYYHTDRYLITDVGNKIVIRLFKDNNGESVLTKEIIVPDNALVVVEVLEN